MLRWIPVAVFGFALDALLAVWIAARFGVGWSLLEIALTAVLGVWLVRREGVRVFTEWRDAVSRGKAPREGVLSGVLILAGGALLLSPGPVGDVLGGLLMVPWVRQRIGARMKASFDAQVASGQVRVVSVQQVRVVSPSPRTMNGVIDTEGELVGAEDGVLDTTAEAVPRLPSRRADEEA